MPSKLKTCPKCGHMSHAGEWPVSNYSAGEISPGSCWRRKEGGRLVLVDETIYGHLGRVRVVDPEGRWDSRATPADFRAAFEWVADPGEKS